VKSPLYLIDNLPSGQLNHVFWHWPLGLLSQKITINTNLSVVGHNTFQLTLNLECKISVVDYSIFFATFVFKNNIQCVGLGNMKEEFGEDPRSWTHAIPP
jgi:hypothetical protein